MDRGLATTVLVVVLVVLAIFGVIWLAGQID